MHHLEMSHQLNNYLHSAEIVKSNIFFSRSFVNFIFLCFAYSTPLHIFYQHPALMEKTSTLPPLSASQSQDSEREDDDHDFDLHDYDLDVVDNVLNNPHQTEYYDHFGFKIEVKTDDEDSDGSSDEDSDGEHTNNCDLSQKTPLHAQKQQPAQNEKGHVSEFDATQHHQQDTISRRRYSNGSSNIEKICFFVNNFRQ
jgi:hypothetical protein